MKKNKDFKEIKKYVLITLFICIIISSLGIAFSGVMFIGVFIGVCVFALILLFVIPLIKGNRGEFLVSKILKDIVEKYGGKIINDVIIVDENQSSQIDHILFHTSGIYVVETKNYSGRIYGKYDQREWTQVLADGRVKNKLYSPIYQNNVHIKRLEHILKINNMISCIVLIKGNIKDIEANNVYSPKTLKSFIIDNINNNKYSTIEIEKFYNEINEYKINPVKTPKEHLKDIKNRRKNINNNICPNCNIPLILRTSKNGNQFYGCSNYPKCKFTKNMD